MMRLLLCCSLGFASSASAQLQKGQGRSAVIVETAAREPIVCPPGVLELHTRDVVLPAGASISYRGAGALTINQLTSGELLDSNIVAGSVVRKEGEWFVSPARASYTLTASNSGPATFTVASLLARGNRIYAKHSVPAGIRKIHTDRKRVIRTTGSGQLIVCPPRALTLTANMVEAPAGTLIAPHSHPTLSFAHILNGQALDENYVTGQSRRLRSHDWAIDPLGQDHGGRVEGDGPIRLVAYHLIPPGVPASIPRKHDEIPPPK